VALARALATAPRLLLLDEPTAALDAGAKVELRREIRRHLATFQGTRLLVTHDPLEAATLADRLVVLEAGRVVQSGTPVEVSERPRSQYVAELVGINLLRGRAEGYRVVLASGGSLVVATQARGGVFAVVHPRAVALHARRPEGSARNVWHEKVMSLDLEGSRVRVRMDGEVPLVGEGNTGGGRRSGSGRRGTGLGLRQGDRGQCLPGLTRRDLGRTPRTAPRAMTIHPARYAKAAVGEIAVHRSPATALAARLPKLWMPAKTPKAEPLSAPGATAATAAFWEVSTQPMAIPAERKAGARATTLDPPMAKPA